MSRSDEGTRVRRHDRFGTSFTPVPVSFSGGSEGSGALYDISVGGCRVITSVSVPLGSSLTLRVQYSKTAPPISVDIGIVAWAKNKVCFGVQFVTLQPKEERALHFYLNHLNRSFLSTATDPIP